MTLQPDADQIQQMAEEIFEVWTLSWIGTENADKYDLSESEILTLDLLTKNPSLNVGELQRGIGVSPTKMSRLIRKLERDADPPLVHRGFNAEDRRKIDVSITKAGREAHRAFRSSKLSRTIEVLAEMNGEDRAEFLRLVRILRQKLLATQAPLHAQRQ